MDSTLLIKLKKQIERQSAEAVILESQAASYQGAIDAAQAILDACKADLETAQQNLNAVDSSDETTRTELQAVVNSAQNAASEAEKAFSAAKAPQEIAVNHAKQIRNQILQCEQAIANSGITMTDTEIDQRIATASKECIWEAIKAFRDSRKEKGVSVAGKWFHSDNSSRIQQLGLVMMGANIPAGLLWKTMDGTFVTMTQQLAGQIFQATAASDIAIHAVAEQHKANLFASQAPEAYDWKTGWPSVFS